MDRYDRSMSRARAERRLERKRGGSLWGFETWDNEGKEEHHIGRKKYSDLTIPIPISMHRELTRRQREKHPPEGPDPRNPLERQGRLFLGLADILECLVDWYRWIAEDLVGAAKGCVRDLRDTGDNPDWLAETRA